VPAIPLEGKSGDRHRGASSGFGKAIGRRVSATKAVKVCGRARPNRAASRATFAHRSLDVTDPEELRALRRRRPSSAGRRPDILVNNAAARFGRYPFSESTERTRNG
jgi:NAD(P)-dependent dehydrogenase (short-subunit alcohol dehydrogenase family)